MPFAELFNDVRSFMKIVRGQKFMMFHSNAGLVKGYCKGRKGLGMLSTILCGDDNQSCSQSVAITVTQWLHILLTKLLASYTQVAFEHFQS